MPSGRIIGVRGYEDAAIDILLKTYSEDALMFDDRMSQYRLPIFDYVTVNQHTAKYYPDIYIPEENKLIEIKSPWWWDGKGSPKYSSRLQNNLRKKDAVLAAGFEYDVWLFTDKHNYEILTWK